MLYYALRCVTYCHNSTLQSIICSLYSLKKCTLLQLLCSHSLVAPDNTGQNEFHKSTKHSGYFSLSLYLPLRMLSHISVKSLVTKCSRNLLPHSLGQWEEKPQIKYKVKKIIWLLLVKSWLVSFLNCLLKKQYLKCIKVITHLIKATKSQNILLHKLKFMSSWKKLLNWWNLQTRRWKISKF